MREVTLDLFQDPKVREDYREWMNNPMTNLVLAAVRDNLLRPIIPGYSVGAPKLNEKSAEFCIGENAGAWKLYDSIQKLDVLSTPKKTEEPREVYPTTEQ